MSQEMLTKITIAVKHAKDLDELFCFVTVVKNEVSGVADFADFGLNIVATQTLRSLEPGRFSSVAMSRMDGTMST